MGIVRLTNPKTRLYKEVKSYILSGRFPWYFHEQQHPDEYHDDNPNAKHMFVHPKMNLDKLGHVPMHNHGFLGRPEPLPRLEDVEYLPMVYGMMKEILSYNRIHPEVVYRIAANQVRPNSNIDTTHIHIDHYFPHKNMLIYFTDAGGETIIEDDYHDPQEDDVIVFEGYHTHNVPKLKTRVVLVATYL